MSDYYVYVHTPPNRERPLFSCYTEEQAFEGIRAAWKVGGDGVTTATQAIASVLLMFADQWVGSNIEITRLIPREPTNDEKLEAARRILRADYWDDVRSVVSDIKTDIERGNLTDRDEVTEAIDEHIDSHHRVTYTYAAIETLYFSDNDGAYEEHFGSEGMAEDGRVQYERLAFYAMRQDVTDMLGDVEDLLAEAETTCYWCGIAFTEDDETDTELISNTPHRTHDECPEDEEEGDDE